MLMTNQNCMEWSGHLVLVLMFFSLVFSCSQQRAGLKKQVHPFLMISPPASHLHCYLWVSKTCLVSLDVRDFSVVMPGWQEITKACLKRYFQLILHVAFFGIQMWWCERAWLDASGMWRNEAIHFRMGLERIGLSDQRELHAGLMVSPGFTGFSTPRLFALWVFSHLLPCLWKYHAYMVTAALSTMKVLMVTVWQHDDSMCP